MEKLWLIYWGLLFLSLLFGIVMIAKKAYITGIIQAALSIILPVWAFVFALKRDYLNAQVNEISFLISKIAEFDVEAIALLIMFIILIGICCYHILLLKKKH